MDPLPIFYVDYTKAPLFICVWIVFYQLQFLKVAAFILKLRWYAL